MLTFFVTPYDDELLYSIVARHHYYTGNRATRITLYELFGDTSVLPSIYVPSRLGHLASVIRGIEVTPAYFIQRHTVLPYYLHFMRPTKYDATVADTISSGGESLFTQTGLASGGICRKSGLYYCPICMDEDIRTVGEPYFHRCHHLEGISVCWKHGCLLRAYEPFSEKRGRTTLFRLEEGKTDKTPAYPNAEVTHTLKSLASVASTMVHTAYNSPTYQQIHEAILMLLKNRRYMTRKGNIRQKELGADVKSYFTEQILRMTESDFDEGSHDSWICCIFRSIPAAIPPAFGRQFR